MNFIKKSSLSLLLLGFSLSHAASEDYKQLEVHVEECLDYLEVFTNPDFNPKKTIQKVYENGSLILRYDEEAITKTEKLAEKWISDCGDLFISDKYDPGFIRNSPIFNVVSDRVKNQSFRKKNSAPIVGHSGASEDEKPFKLKATFNSGYLHELEVIAPYTNVFQYDYDGEHLIWGRFDNEDVLGIGWSETPFAYSFTRYGDSLRYTSPFMSYTTENKGRNSWGERKASPKTWQVKDVSESALNGQINHEKNLFVAIPKGNKNRSWAIKLAATIGIHGFAYTDDLIKDNNWVADSTKYMGGFGALGFLVDITAGVVHCMPSSGSCFGFGAGYSHNGYDGYVIDEENSWYHEVVKNKMKHTDNLKLYGEYYLNGKSPKGFRESIDIPLNANIKYLTSKTGFFWGKWMRYEAGLEVSPIQFIPGIYFELGMQFTTPALW